MRNIYNFFIYCYSIAIHLAALLNHSKAQKWISGRKGWEKKLAESNPQRRKVVWFHTASLGEFEQARPLIEKYREEQAHLFILLTFFSPSGYEIRQNYAGVDLVCYLPLDTIKNAKKFISIAQPELVVFVKYEFWFNFLSALKQRHIKTIMISGIFRKNQHFFKWYGHWFMKQLHAFNFFYLQDENSKKLLNDIGFTNCKVTGDNRFDQVIKLSQTPFANASVESMCKEHQVIVFGSSWAAEDDFAIRFCQDFPDWKIIIAPHEIKRDKVARLIEKLNAKTICWSQLEENQDISDYGALIMDQVGLLSKLYRYGTIAFIGGGFAKGIHNLLEASVYGIPVIFGPNFQKFQEARELIENKAGYTVNDYQEFELIIKNLADKELLDTSRQAALNYIKYKSGATAAIYHELISG